MRFADGKPTGVTDTVYHELGSIMRGEVWTLILLFLGLLTHTEDMICITFVSMRCNVPHSARAKTFLHHRFGT